MVKRRHLRASAAKAVPKRHKAAQSTLGSKAHDKQDGTQFMLRLDASAVDSPQTLFAALLSRPAHSDVEDPDAVPADKFSRLIYPMCETDFFENVFEQRCLLIQRNRTQSAPSVQPGALFSYEQMLQIIRNTPLTYDTNIAVCKYENAHRSNMSFEGLINADEVHQCFSQAGFTIQFYSPQRFSHPLWYLLESCERKFNCLSGASAYLTPTGAQGLAPHHDDVDVFIVQCEGQKTWKLYAPEMLLPDTYSNDIPREKLGTPCIVVLREGDVLYMPRGTVHEAVCSKDHDLHSTHVTISVYQQNHFKTLLTAIFPLALQKSFVQDLQFRKGIPRDLFDTFGTYRAWRLQRRHKESTSQASVPCPRQHIAACVQQLLSSLASVVSLELIDQAVDNMSDDFERNRLPGPCEGDRIELDERTDDQLSMTSMIRSCHPRHMRASVVEISQGRALALAHTRFHDPSTHMSTRSDANGGNANGHAETTDTDEARKTPDTQARVIVPLVCGLVLDLLHAQFPKFVSVKHVREAVKLDRGQTLAVCRILYSYGYVDVHRDQETR